MRNGGVLRRLGSVVVVLAVVSLALYEVGHSDKVAAEMNRYVIGNYHLNAEIEGADRAMLREEKLVSPFSGRELGACLTDGVKRAELCQHPILLGGIFKKLDLVFHSIAYLSKNNIFINMILSYN